MKSSDVEALCIGIRQLRKWGFSLVHTHALALQSVEDQATGARFAACAMLGLKHTKENLRSLDVDKLSRTLGQNTETPAMPGVVWDGIHGDAVEGYTAADDARDRAAAGEPPNPHWDVSAEIQCIGNSSQLKS